MTDINRNIEALRGRQAAIYAVGMAECTRVVFARWASGSTRDLAASAIDRMWAACSGASADTNELVELLTAVPEATVDDSHRRDYYVMRAVGIVYYAAETLREVMAAPSGLPADPLRFSDQAITEFAADLNAAAKRGDNPFQGDLIETLADLKKGVLSELNLINSQDLSTAVGKVRNATADFSSLLLLALPIIAQNNGWPPGPFGVS